MTGVGFLVGWVVLPMRFVLLLIAAGLLAALNLLVMAGGIGNILPARQPAPAADVSSIPRLVVIVADGVDHDLLARYFAQDELPHLRQLARDGAFHPLESEIPPESPVAMASLLTGVNPARHGIFDFVTSGRDYAPRNGMVALDPARLLLGRVLIRPPRPRSRLSYPTFLDRVWQAGYPVVGLNVPLSFPVAPQPGTWATSGLGTPDLSGGAGSYAIYSSRLGFEPGQTTFGGRRIPLEREAPEVFAAFVEGPVDPSLSRGAQGERRLARVPLRMRRDLEAGEVRLEIGGSEAVLRRPGERSAFLAVDFPLGTWPSRSVRGLVRFTLRSLEPLEVFTDAVNLDPRQSPLPVTAPREYGSLLWAHYGPFETVGWREQTFQRNDGWQDDEGFLADLGEDMERSGAQFLGELARRPDARLFCVTFTATDRACHMFWRYLDPAHPLHAPLPSTGDPILQVLSRLDDIVGRVRERLDPEDLLLVVSDHGFESWRWSLNLNQFLVDRGDLVLRRAAPHKHLRGFFAQARDVVGMETVDWTRSRAFAMGLGQIYLNRRDRFEQGIVEPEEVDALCEGLTRDLMALENPFLTGGEDTPRRPIRRVIRTAHHWQGPELVHAPELQVAFDRAYRVSWQTALGGGMGLPGDLALFERNTAPWSGDHCSQDPDLVPGVLLCNRPVVSAPPDHPYHVRDVAATVLAHFGLPTAALDGRPIPHGR